MMPAPIPAPPMAGKFLTTREAAARLGVSYGYLRLAVHRAGGRFCNIIPARLKDKSLRWPASHVDILAGLRALAYRRGVKKGTYRHEAMPW